MCLAAHAINVQELERARNRQDRVALQRIIADATAAAGKQPRNPAAQYDLALAQSYLAEVASELRDRDQATSAAEAGIRAAEKAVEIDGGRAEYYRVLGTLCGQAVTGNVLAGLRYGRCALDSLNKAISLDQKNALAWLSRGVGYYYLPATFGGGVTPALNDIRKAIQLNPRHADSWLWLGIALRKANRNGEARQAIAKAVQLNPERVWAKQQLDKTPVR
jgi:tetratricopeptide (TPR) repeat protein